MNSKTPLASSPAGENLIRLHLGCGDDRWEGWINVDLVPTKATDLVLDIRHLRGRFPEGSCQAIHLMHAINYLALWEAREFFATARKLLAPGGELVIETVDASKAARKLLEGMGGDLGQYMEGVRAFPGFGNDHLQEQREYTPNKMAWTPWHLGQELAKVGFASCVEEQVRTHAAWRDFRMVAKVSASVDRSVPVQTPPARIRTKRLLIVVDEEAGHVTAHIRGHMFVEPLSRKGWAATVLDARKDDRDRILREAGDSDAVLLAKVPSLALVRDIKAAARGAVVYDFTDALWLPFHQAHGWQDIDAILGEADAVVCDNRHILQYALRHNPRSGLWPASTRVELFDQARTSSTPRRDGKVRIGWMGSQGTASAIAAVAGPLAKVASRHPGLELRVLGCSDPSILPEIPGLSFSRTGAYDEPAMIQEVLRMDVGIFPAPSSLEDYRNRGPLKGLLYMSAGVPAVCQRGGELDDVVTHGVDGFLADSPEDWEACLESLVSSAERRAAMGCAARARVSDRALDPITDVLIERIETANALKSGPRSRRPRVLVLADVKGWIFERHALTLQKNLADEFDIEVRYQGERFDEDRYDLVYPLEWNLVPPGEIREPRKWVTGIRSHVSWEGLDPARFGEILRTKFAKVHAVSKRLCAATARFRPDIAPLTHGVDMDHFRSPAEPFPESGRIRIGWAGNRKSPVKGFEEFIEPLASLPGVELVFCGYSDRLLDMEAMKSFYEQIDVYICSSLTEGNNNSLLEAAAMGRAIVTTDVGTVPEYLRDGESALIVPRSAEAFRAAVERLLEDPGFGRELGRRARESVRAFAWTVKLGEHRTFLRQALAAVPSATDRGEASCEAAEALVAEGKIEEALSVLREFQESGGESPRASRLVGRILLALERLTDAQVELIKATKLWPNDPQWHEDLAAVLIRRNQGDRAELSLRKVLELDPNRVEAAFSLGRSLLLRDDPAAVGTLSVLVERHPGHPRALDAWILLLLAAKPAPCPPSGEPMHREVLRAAEDILRSGKPGEALALLLAALKMWEESSFLLAGIAVAWLKSGDLPSARAFFSRTLEFEPGSSVAQEFLAELPAVPAERLEKVPARSWGAAVPRIHLGMLTFNALASTKMSLESIARTAVLPHRLHILDNASAKDETRAWLAAQDAPQLHVTLGEYNLGVPAGRNLLTGIALEEMRDEDWFVSVDNDMEFFPGWDEKVLAYLDAHPEIGVLSADGHQMVVREADRILLPKHLEPSVVDVACGGYVCWISAKVLKAVGGYDENLGLFWHEDDDFTIHALASGFEAVAYPMMPVLHHGHKSGAATPGIAVGGSPGNQKYLCEKWRRLGLVDANGRIRRGSHPKGLRQEGRLEKAGELFLTRHPQGQRQRKLSAAAAASEDPERAEVGSRPQPRIGFDARTFSIPASVVRGIGHYSRHHLEALVQARPGCDLTALVDDVEPLPEAILADFARLGVRTRKWSESSASDFDLVHVADPMFCELGFASPLPRFSSTRLTATFYDIIPLRWYAGRVGNFSGYLARLEGFVASKARFLCISEFTRRDLLDATGMDPARTAMIGAGFNASRSGRTWTREEGDALLRRLGIADRFLLHVGAVDPHKNPEAVLSIGQTLGRAHSVQLVFAGKIAHSIESVRDQVVALGWKDVVFTDFLSREELELLYSRAVATLFMSRYEGFGFPALEAMANGCPVVCSDATSLPEVVGDAAMMHKPDDLEGAARSVLALMGDPALRQSYVERGAARARRFQWSEVARRTWEEWDRMLAEGIPPARAPEEPASVLWAGPVWDPSGYGDETRSFLRHFEASGLNPASFHVGRFSPSFRKAAPDSDLALFGAMMRREVPPGTPVVIDMPGSALRRLPVGGHHVGRTTFETDSLPAEWLPACNAMDEIWVPCEFNARTFRDAGVSVPILVVPEGVDSSRFRPGLEPLELPGPARSTTFLSVFEWTHRKGPDVLLSAWARAFGPSDDVRLVLRTYPPNQVEGDPAAWIDDRIRHVLAAVGRGRGDCAPIVVLGTQIPDADMPRLYAAADAYVAPSRGEGWGRPHMEAMACGVPVVATAWSGNLEFQDNDNSWLIALDGMETVDGREEFEGYRGHRWANPSVADLARLLRSVAADPEARRAKGERARADIVARWDWTRIAPIAETRLGEIRRGVPAERSVLAAGYRAMVGEGLAQREAPTATELQWVGPLFNHSGYARFGREAVAALEGDGSRVHLDPQLNDARWFEGLRGNAKAMAFWKSLLGRRGRRGPVVVCDIPRSADGRSDLLGQILQAYPDTSPTAVWTMFETDRLPVGWADSLNRMDQVWVPSRHNLRTFRDAGVEASKLRVVPCGIDPAPFDAVRGKPMPIPGRPAATTFLSVFQWSRRKGWDILLEAWSKAFDAGDDVRLVLRCHPFADAPPVSVQVERWFSERGLDRARLAPIVVLDDFLPEDGMPALYEAADVFVLPSRGEGWGLPYLEAMAAGKPCIGTTWAASGEFLHEGVGWMLPEHGTVPVGAEACEENPFLTPDHEWAEVKVEDLVEALRRAQSSPEERRIRGRRAGEEVRSRWSPRETARAIREALSSGTTQAPIQAPGVQRLLPALRGRIPIAMPAYNRHGYLREVLEGLRGCRDLDRFCIVTGEEPGCPETKALFDAVDWMPIVRTIHSERQGCNANVLGTIDRALEIGDRFVSLEDDIVPGQDFLSFVSWGLERFRGDSSIFDVCGYQRHVDPPARSEAGEVRSFDWFCPWGWASWRDRWERFRSEVRVPNSGAESWDYFLCKWVVESARLKELRPSVGRVQNIGEEGTWVPSAQWHRENHRTPHWIGNLGWEPVARGGFHLPGEQPGKGIERPAVGSVGTFRLTGAIAGVAAGLLSRRTAAKVDTSIAKGHAAPGLPGGLPGEAFLSVRWEGSQFVHHSLAHVNRSLCAGLAKAGHDLSLIPFEADQFGPGEDRDLRMLANLVNAPLEGPCQVHVRHQWPPNLTPPSEGRWVVIQPWEFGSPPKEWIEAFRDTVDDLWAYTDYVRDMYLRAGIPADRVHVVPLGVDCDKFRPGTPALATLPPKRGLRFLYVGGTIARKGFDKLLNAWQKAFGPDDPVELLVKDMGGKTTYAGQTGEAHVRRIQESGRFATIHYVNSDLDPADLPSLYASGDVLVHPYRGEGFGLPIAEAMACGLPVVITQGGAADDFCGPEEAWMIPAEKVVLPGGKVGDTETVESAWWLEPSEESLVLALREAASDAQARVRKGAAARERILSGFTWDHALAKAQERLASVASRPVRRTADKSPASPEPAAAGTSSPASAGEALEGLSLLLFQVETAVALQDSARAEVLSREAVELHPDQPLAWLSRAMVLRGAGKSGKALEALAKSASVGGGAEVLYETMALHLQEGRNAPALVQWNLLRTKHPQWVKQRKAMHQAQGLPWLPDRFAKPGTSAKKPAGKKR